MTAQMSYILKQYDELHMSIEDICADSGGELESESVKSVLAQYSAKYRESHKKENNSDEFTQDEADLARQTIAQIMQSTDDDYLRFRTAKFIRDDKKGRLDVTQMNKLNINVLVFNDALKKLKGVRERTLAMKDANVVEVSQPVETNK